MPSPRVRLYEQEPTSTILGFSYSAAEASSHPDLAAFLTSRGYEFSPVERFSGCRSRALLEIRPPLREEDVPLLGALCVGNQVEGEYVPGIIPKSREAVSFIDNRGLQPEEDGVVLMTSLKPPIISLELQAA